MAERVVRKTGVWKGPASVGEPQPQLLIVEDDPNISEVLDTYFSVQGYEVLTAQRGEDGVKMCREKLPDLVLLDIRLPDIDGYEIAGRLKSDPRTQHIPIFFLTEQRERVNRLAGLELGVVDYITKPFDMQELRLRVRNVLRRTARRPMPKHPATGLPEGAAVDARLESLLDDKSPWALLALSLTGLKSYQKRYGVVAGDDALRGVSLTLRTALSEKDDDLKDDFAGHLGPEDFVVVTLESRLKDLKRRLVDDICAALPYCYPSQDRGQDRDLRSKKGKVRRERLDLQVGSLKAGDGPFESLDALKEEALSVLETV